MAGAENLTTGGSSDGTLQPLSDPDISLKPFFVPAKPGISIPGLRPPVHGKDIVIPLTTTPDNCPDIPYEDRKFVLKRVQMEAAVDGKNIASLWDKRSLFAEKRLQKLTSEIPGVQNVVRHERYTKDDSAGKDLYFEKDGLGINMEIKCSSFGVHAFKKWVWETYFPDSPYNEAVINNWLIENRIVLVNGSETRSNKQIYATILPQIRLIQEYVATNQAA